MGSGKPWALENFLPWALESSVCIRVTSPDSTLFFCSNSVTFSSRDSIVYVFWKRSYLKWASVSHKWSLKSNLRIAITEILPSTAKISWRYQSNDYEWAESCPPVKHVIKWKGGVKLQRFAPSSSSLSSKSSSVPFINYHIMKQNVWKIKYFMH